MIRVDDTYLAGSFDWREDAFFRPTIAVYSGNALSDIVPTYRRLEPSTSGQAVWRCAVPERAVRLTERSQVTCLETGEILFSGPTTGEGEGPAGSSSVAWLIERTRRHRKPAQASGFPHFLLLPLVDQLSILAKDLLEVDLADEVQRDVERRIVAGELTILDVRDELLRSDVFGQTPRRSVDEHLGRWLVWEGLSGAEPRVLRAARDPGRRMNLRDEIRLTAYLAGGRSSEDTSLHLAKIALGGQAPVATLQQWIGDHATEIGQLISLRDGSAYAMPPVSIQRSGQLRYPNLLSMMTLGPRGKRQGSAVASSGGTEGVLAFGPYMKIGPGRYRLTGRVSAAAVEASREIRAQSSGARSPELIVEMAYRDFVLAHRTFRLDNPASLEFSLDYEIEPAWWHIINESLFEVRLSVRGSRVIIIHELGLESLPHALAASPREEWLPRMTRKTRRENKGFLGRFRSRPSVLYHGPYVRFMPGRYELTILFDQRDPAPPAIDLAVKSGTDILAHDSFRFDAVPAITKLSFSIADAGSFDELPAPLEFVVSSRRKIETEIISVATERLSQSAEAEPRPEDNNP